MVICDVLSDSFSFLSRFDTLQRNTWQLVRIPAQHLMPSAYMRSFGNIFGTLIVLFSAATQLLPPAAEWLHLGCSHSVRLACVSCSSACPDTRGIVSRQECSRSKPHAMCATRSDQHVSDQSHDVQSQLFDGSSEGIPADEPIPHHAPEDCPIWQVLMAARLSAEAAETPTCGHRFAFAVPLMARIAERNRRFELPVRGPPSA